jgi:hypothetical protein
MGIVGQHPESGVRIDVQRARVGGPPWRYEGEAATPSELLPLRALVEADGSVTVELEGQSGPDRPALAEKVRLMLRAAWKHGAQEDGGAAAPPRRIVRWRPEP